MKKHNVMFLILAVLIMSCAVNLTADDEVENPVGVAGCGSIAVDPESSLEFQQNICNSAEGDPGTSCGATGHGTCSSPKLNDTMPDANHCICVGEETEVALADGEVPVV